MYSKEFVLKRHLENPIIKPMDFPGAAAIFNPGQTMYNEKTLLLVSILHKSNYYNGKPGATTHVAESADGIHFDINPEPFLQIPDIEPYNNLDLHPIDTRITKIDDTYYILHPGCSSWRTLGILGKAKDFKKYEYMDIVSMPHNRGSSLFPEKINGEYVRLDRPGGGDFGDIWISYSKDLIYWGRHRPLLKPYNYWNITKVGPTPPIKTEKGWLEIIHGVQIIPYHNAIYSLGAIMLDLEDPSRVIGKTESFILTPEEPYELAGRVPNTIFTTGAIADHNKDIIRIYYGAADTCIGLATGSLSKLLDLCLNSG